MRALRCRVLLGCRWLVLCLCVSACVGLRLRNTFCVLQPLKTAQDVPGDVMPLNPAQPSVTRASPVDLWLLKAKPSASCVSQADSLTIRVSVFGDILCGRFLWWDTPRVFPPPNIAHAFSAQGCRCASTALRAPALSPRRALSGVLSATLGASFPLPGKPLVLTAKLALPMLRRVHRNVPSVFLDVLRTRY